MTNRKRPSAMSSSFVSGAITQNSLSQPSTAYLDNSNRRMLDVDRLVEKLGPLSSAPASAPSRSHHLGHHFSLAKGGLCSVSSAPSKLGRNIHKEDLGGSGHAQDIFEVVYPIARRSQANGETELEDMMRRYGLLAPGESVKDLKTISLSRQTSRMGTGKLTTINEISASIIDSQTKDTQRIVQIKNNDGKYSLDFRY